MKVSDLTGPLLDYWVARAQGNMKAGISSTFGEEPMCYWYAGAWTGGPYHPSTDWAHGGPIIDRVLEMGATVEDCYCVIPSITSPGGMGKGDTTLQAVCRAYVASVYGEEVPEVAL